MEGQKGFFPPPPPSPPVELTPPTLSIVPQTKLESDLEAWTVTKPVWHATPTGALQKLPLGWEQAKKNWGDSEDQRRDKRLSAPPPL